MKRFNVEEVQEVTVLMTAIEIIMALEAGVGD